LQRGGVMDTLKTNVLSYGNEVAHRNNTVVL